MSKKIIYIDNFLTGHGFTPTTGAAIVQLLSDEGYEMICASRKKGKFLRLTDMLATIVHNRKDATVFIATYSTHAFYFAWICSRLCRILQLKYVPCLHGGNLPQRIQEWPVMSAQLFGNSFINVAVSAYLQEHLEKRNWTTIVIPNYINLSFYPFLQRQNCSPKLLWVRSFHVMYNPAMALTVLQQLLLTRPDASLTMAGPDKDGSLDECKRLAKEMGIEDKLHFTGLLTKEEWIALSAQHDIFINTTNFDNLPVSVIEAMALGMIIISTDAGGMKYLINTKRNGILVPVNNAEAMLAAILEVINNSELAKKLSSRARKDAEEYDQQKIKLKWTNVLGRI